MLNPKFPVGGVEQKGTGNKRSLQQGWTEPARMARRLLASG